MRNDRLTPEEKARGKARMVYAARFGEHPDTGKPVTPKGCFNRVLVVLFGLAFAAIATYLILTDNTTIGNLYRTVQTIEAQEVLTPSPTPIDLWGDPDPLDLLRELYATPEAP